MLSIEEIRKKLEDMNLSSVARKIGISEQILYRVVRGEDMKASTAEKLSKYFIERESSLSSSSSANHD